LAVAIFPWRSEDFAVSPSSLAAKPPRKIILGGWPLSKIRHE